MQKIKMMNRGVWTSTPSSFRGRGTTKSLSFNHTHMSDDKARGFVEGMIEGVRDAREQKKEKENKREEAYKRANEDTSKE